MAISKSSSWSMQSSTREIDTPPHTTYLVKCQHTTRMTYATPSSEDLQWRGEARQRLVWMFSSTESPSVFPTGIWTSKEKAEVWIASVSASGVLSGYLLDKSAWDSNVRLGLLKLSKPERDTSEFKRKFTTAIDHFHYKDGHSS